MEWTPTLFLPSVLSAVTAIGALALMRRRNKDDLFKVLARGLPIILALVAAQEGPLMYSAAKDVLLFSMFFFQEVSADPPLKEREKRQEKNDEKPHKMRRASADPLQKEHRKRQKKSQKKSDEKPHKTRRASADPPQKERGKRRKKNDEKSHKTRRARARNSR